MDGLLIHEREKVDLAQVMLNNQQLQAIENIINEQHFGDQLVSYGLPLDHKLLLYGSSGCGKTMVAKALATTLNKKLLVLDLAHIVSARIGETGQQLKLVFERAAKEKAILFLDEFDQIGKSRLHEEKDVGEMRRLVNTLIQLMDYLPPQVLLIAATNHLAILDPALLRRFQLKMGFEMPDRPALDYFYDQLLENFPIAFREITRTYAISFAEARDMAYTQVKKAILDTLINGIKTNN